MKRKAPKWLKPAGRIGRNKYVITAIAFVVWITFFDRNDLITQVGYVVHLHELRNQKAYLEEQIDTTNQQLHELLSNPERLKKFAREEYFMKKEGEDVFIIQKSSKR